jgi:DNA repair exonuclease SbcCD ATPase subunit
MAGIRGWQIRRGELELEHLNTAAREFLNLLNQRAETLTRELSELQDQLSRLDEALNRLEQSFGGFAAESVAAIAELRDDLTATSAELDNVKSQLETGLSNLLATINEAVSNLTERVEAIEGQIAQGTEASVRLIELSGTMQVQEPTIITVLEARLTALGSLKVYADSELIAEYYDAPGTYRFNPAGEGMATSEVKVEGPGSALIALTKLSLE